MGGGHVSERATEHMQQLHNTMLQLRDETNVRGGEAETAVFISAAG